MQDNLQSKLSKTTSYLLNTAQIKTNLIQQQILMLYNTKYSCNEIKKITKTGTYIFDTLESIFADLGIPRVFNVVKRTGYVFNNLCSHLTIQLEKQINKNRGKNGNVNLNSSKAKLVAPVSIEQETHQQSKEDSNKYNSNNKSNMSHQNQKNTLKQRPNRLGGICLYNQNYKRKIDEMNISDHNQKQGQQNQNNWHKNLTKNKEKASIDKQIHDQKDEKQFKKKLFKSMKNQLKQLQQFIYSPFPDQVSTFLMFQKKFLQSFNHLSHAQNIQSIVSYLQTSHTNALQAMRKSQDLTEQISNFKTETEQLIRQAKLRNKERNQNLSQKFDSILQKFIKKRIQIYKKTSQKINDYNKLQKQKQMNRFSIGVQTNIKQLLTIKNMERRLIDIQMKYKNKEEQKQKLYKTQIQKCSNEKSLYFMELNRCKVAQKGIQQDLQQTRKKYNKVVQSLHQKQVLIKKFQKFRHNSKIINKNWQQFNKHQSSPGSHTNIDFNDNLNGLTQAQNVTNVSKQVKLSMRMSNLVKPTNNMQVYNNQNKKSHFQKLNISVTNNNVTNESNDSMLPQIRNQNRKLTRQNIENQKNESKSPSIKQIQQETGQKLKEAILTEKVVEDKDQYNIQQLEMSMQQKFGMSVKKIKIHEVNHSNVNIRQKSLRSIKNKNNLENKSQLQIQNGSSFINLSPLSNTEFVSIKHSQNQQVKRYSSSKKHIQQQIEQVKKTSVKLSDGISHNKQQKTPQKYLLNIKNPNASRKEVHQTSLNKSRSREHRQQELKKQRNRNRLKTGLSLAKQHSQKQISNENQLSSEQDVSKIQINTIKQDNRTEKHISAIHSNQQIVQKHQNRQKEHPNSNYNLSVFHIKQSNTVSSQRIKSNHQVNRSNNHMDQPLPIIIKSAAHRSRSIKNSGSNVENCQLQNHQLEQNMCRLDQQVLKLKKQLVRLQCTHVFQLSFNNNIVKLQQLNIQDKADHLSASSNNNNCAYNYGKQQAHQLKQRILKQKLKYKHDMSTLLYQNRNTGSQNRAALHSTEVLQQIQRHATKYNQNHRHNNNSISKINSEYGGMGNKRQLKSLHMDCRNQPSYSILQGQPAQLNKTTNLPNLAHKFMFKCKLDDSNTAYVSNKQFFKIKSLSKERGNEDIIRNIHNINVISQPLANIYENKKFIKDILLNGIRHRNKKQTLSFSFKHQEIQNLNHINSSKQNQNSVYVQNDGPNIQISNGKSDGHNQVNMNGKKIHVNHGNSGQILKKLKKKKDEFQKNCTMTKKLHNSISQLPQINIKHLA